MNKNKDLLIVEGGRVKKASEPESVRRGPTNTVRELLREARREPKRGRQIKDKGAAGRKYDRYRGADNPNNGHGVAKRWKKSGVQCELVEVKRPTTRGKKSKRLRRHKWVPVGSTKQRKTRARKS